MVFFSSLWSVIIIACYILCYGQQEIQPVTKMAFVEAIVVQVIFMRFSLSDEVEIIGNTHFVNDVQE